MKLAILGHFGEGVTMLDGQTIKTQNLVYGLNKYSNIEAYKIDTHGWVKHPFALLKKIRKGFLECESFVMLPAHNGLRVFSYVLVYYKKKFNKKIFYDVIGGWLPEFLPKRKRLTNTLKKFDGIWVETKTMRQKLEALGYDNITVVPNFKELNPLSEFELSYQSSSPYKLCTFSRVMKEKGIEIAANAVMSVNSKLGYQAFSLDIYGQVTEENREWFDSVKEKFDSSVNYCGLVDADKSVTVLKDYFALLFPTFYSGEGFAGTIIDAYSAGLPVIASDWRYNKELVNSETGFLFPTGDDDLLCQILERIALNPNEVFDKKTQCLIESEKFRIDKVIDIIVKQIAF